MQSREQAKPPQVRFGALAGAFC